MQEPTDPRSNPVSPVIPLPVCGYCDEFVDPTLHLPCPTCGAHAHHHCLVKHGGCPTPGCEVTGPIARPTVAARTLPPVERVATLAIGRSERGLRRWTSTAGGFSFSLGAGGVILSLIAVGSPAGVFLGSAGLIVGTTFMVLGAWLHSLVTLYASPLGLGSLRTISAILAGTCLGSGLVGLLGSTIGLAILDTGAAFASAEALRLAVAASSALLSGGALVLSGGLNLVLLALDMVRRQR
ncbi:MAG: hypothetical protein AAGA48_27355 [Myxococcota bacterium]